MDGLPAAVLAGALAWAGCAAANPEGDGPGASEHAPPPCPLPAVAERREPALCAQLADDAVAAFGSNRLDALVEFARRDISQSAFDAAQRNLDCVAALAPARPEPDLRRRLFRTHAALDYARDHMPEALDGLHCALALSSQGEDRKAEASDLNAVGSALRRLGDYRGALAALTESLRMQRTLGEVGGAVLNNIADVYRDLGEPAEALRHYREAHAVYLDADDPAHAAHVQESMAVVALESNQPAQARAWLEEALATYRKHGRRDFELRVHGWLIRTELAEGDLDAARRWSGSGQAVAAENGLRLPASFHLQAARTERLSGDAQAAAARLQRLLLQTDPAAPAISGEERAALYSELALDQEALGEVAAAMSSLRRASEEADAFARAAHDRQLGWLRTRFETAERDRTIARLESDNRLRRLQLTLFALVVSAAGLGGGLWLQRRRQREREQEAARLARKDEELARYRREAGTLAEDRELLQALLDTRDDAMCLLDPEGLVLAANRAACRLLGAEAAGLVGLALGDELDEAQQAALTQALERMEDTTVQMLAILSPNGRALQARLSQWQHGDGPILLELREAEAAVSPTVTGAEEPLPGGLPASDDVPADVGPADGQHSNSQPLNAVLLNGMLSNDTPSNDTPSNEPPAGGLPAAAHITPAETPADDMRQAFRRTLVELMLAAIDGWERSTGDTRLSLAEKSRIWRVAIDDGRLRARSMERYLSLARLPQNPRWRDVLRTAYYVLENCSLDAEIRGDLQQRVDAVLAYTRRSALV